GKFTTNSANSADKQLKICYQKTVKKSNAIPIDYALVFCQLLNPLAPHLMVQINGQKKAVISLKQEQNQSEIEAMAKSDPKISKLLGEQRITKVIFIKNKIDEKKKENSENNPNQKSPQPPNNDNPSDNPEPVPPTDTEN
ncbi:820_t:CDS:2, partial [Entrophospora sp. SA101]